MMAGTVTERGRLDVLDKMTGELLGSVEADDAASTTAALERARGGFAEWSALPAHRRAEVLERFADDLDARREEIAVLLTRETGKILPDSRAELAAAARIFRGFARESLRHFGQSIPLDRQEGLETDLMITAHEPLGVVAAIVAFNFPAELYAHKVGAALAGGNAVVVKPSEANPLVGNRLTAMLHAAGVPADALVVVNGDGAVVGEALSRSSVIRAISFTGSSRVGAIIAENAARNVVRTFLELSANDALVVLDDADIDAAVAGSLDGRLLANGQVCCATKRILVDEAVADEFTRRLVERVSAVVTGDPLDEGVGVGPLISERAAAGVESQIARAVSQGAEVLLGGGREGALVEPTVLRAPRDSDIVVDDEVFGPVFTILPVGGEDEAVRVANASSYGLTAAVFSADVSRAYRVAERIEAAIVSINGSNNYRPDGSSFGGYKRSGLGREGFFTSLDEYTQVKSIVLRGLRTR
ncbi:aldehyde dehydrogenase family protein [Mycetocola reblochoni]|uniref:Aldehyde dehydrogenase n=2 Tax=Mycetocola reblochoni TaxID=331618 RepID=A0A1R4IIF0_9MICO|nr:aldehyde dehydrogenase family protein [Mycetocola reblochoni]RLP69689.1 aldehyde dehydrogenase [Mycetocola reblochoni]SJN19123.1 Aldehyde dehydrogenase [Mycetocola reblochoni REB411]